MLPQIPLLTNFMYFECVAKEEQSKLRKHGYNAWCNIARELIAGHF